ncbi:MAG TPA: glycosyltransferase family 4 protein [Armatimonadota bacterium]
MNQATVLGGAERIMLASMRVAQADGYTPLLACPPGGRLNEAAAAEGFEAIPLEFAWMENRLGPRIVVSYLAGIAWLGRRVRALCRERNVRLLHPASPVAGLYATRAATDLHLPVFLHMHDAQTPKRARREAIRWQARRVSRFLCVSGTVQRMVVGLGIPPDQTTVLYNCLDAAYFTEPPPRMELGPGPHIGLFAQVAPWKGQHVFLEAAELLADRIPSARFHLIGALAHQNDQPYLDALQARAERPPLRGRVIIHGYEPDARAWMTSMDVVAHASVEPEAFGLVVAEAMAMGRPVVATRTGGPEEIVDDGRTGLLAPPSDAAAMADALFAALTRPELGAAARESVISRFSPERFAADLSALYAEALSPARRR